jgi:hypothetical protein
MKGRLRHNWVPFGAGVVIIGQAPLLEQDVDKTPGEIHEIYGAPPPPLEPSSLHGVPGRLQDRGEGVRALA